MADIEITKTECYKQVVKAADKGEWHLVCRLSDIDGDFTVAELRACTEAYKQLNWRD
jgi:hypothetical protein